MSTEEEACPCCPKNSKGQLCKCCPEKLPPAEAEFQKWLDWGEVPYLSIKQARNLMPIPWHNKKGKRPDFIIALPEALPIAVEVKQVDHGDNFLRIEESELNRLMVFANAFRLDLWFAFMTDAYIPHYYLVSSKTFQERRPKRYYGKPTLHVRKRGQEILPVVPFLKAFQAERSKK